MQEESGTGETTRREFVVQATAGLATALTAANLRAQSGTAPSERIAAGFLANGLIQRWTRRPDQSAPGIVLKSSVPGPDTKQRTGVAGDARPRIVYSAAPDHEAVLGTHPGPTIAAGPFAVAWHPGPTLAHLAALC